MYVSVLLAMIGLALAQNNGVQPKLSVEISNSLAQLVAEVPDGTNLMLRKRGINGSVALMSPIMTQLDVDGLSTLISGQAAALSQTTSNSISTVASTQTVLQTNLDSLNSVITNTLWAQLNETQSRLAFAQSVASQALSVADSLANVPPPPPTTAAPTYVLPTCTALRDPANGAVSAHLRGLPGLVATTTCRLGYGVDCTASNAGAVAPMACGQQQCIPSGTGAAWSPPVQASCRRCPTTVRSFFWRTGHDWRSGNPRQNNQLDLVPTTPLAGVSRISLSWQYVVGYGRCSPCGRSGQNLPGETGCGTWTCGGRRGPDVAISLVNGANGGQSVQVYSRQNLRGYDYDSCRERRNELRTGFGSGFDNRNDWGNNNNPNDGCYSPQISVDVTLNAQQRAAMQTWTSVKVVFSVANNDRNMHLNDDPQTPGMNITIWSTAYC
mmetsp:Transcript_8334/g.11661  ORF Transcript_8334/g.11661 Transcript_8334/m.11661 type:complete len:439 (-) Transcript_8334:165-1481(-)